MIPSTRLYVLLLPCSPCSSVRHRPITCTTTKISLRTEVSQEVPHDLMQVILYSEAQDNDPAKLAAEHHRESEQGHRTQARQSKGVQVSLGSRHSYPVYSDNGQRISAWRERAELRLESAKFAELSELTGELLQQLKMGGMSFSIADTHTPGQRRRADQNRSGSLQGPRSTDQRGAGRQRLQSWSA